MENLKIYSDLYPDLILDIMEFFSGKNLKKTNSGEECRTIKEFFEFHNDKHKNYYEAPPVQPHELMHLCEKLCNLGCMGSMGKSLSALENKYFSTIKGDWFFKHYAIKKLIVQKYECAVYGFSYICNKFRSLVVPIIYYTHSGDFTIGTGFYYRNGIATAKHCLVGAKQIAVMNVSKEQLDAATIYVSENPNMDIAFIDLNKGVQELFGNVMLWTEGIPEVMDEVITMGYPKIPGFNHFQTVEKATISSIPQKKFTATTGEIAAIAEEIWMRENLFLITAKIKGGNSGGPVLNKYGEVVGVVSEITFAKGDYDDLGYGAAIPIKFLNEIATTQPEILSGINFVDYVE